MTHYILQTVAFQLLFLIVYDLFLKKETFFNWNRAYLLGTALLSVVLPFIKINSFKTIIPQNFVEVLPTILVGEQNGLEAIKTSEYIGDEVATLTGLEWVLYIGIGIATLLFLIKLARLFQLIYKNPKQWRGNLLLVEVLGTNTAFSFFHYIFLGEQLKARERVAVLSHEAVHVNQKHSIDLLLFEMMRILFWFNPLVYIYQNRMISLHEFIADSKTIKTVGKQEYYKDLLSQVFDTQSVSFINTFYKQSLIKKRIVMLSKTQSNRILKFKYLLLVPIVLGILMYTSCEQEQDVIETQETSIVQQIEQLKTTLQAKESLTKEETEMLRSLLLLNLENNKIVEGHSGEFVIHDSSLSEKGVAFAVIEQVPVFPGCENLSSNEEMKTCMSKKISDFVIGNFNTKKANELGLSGRQRISVIFKIDTDGNVIDVKSRAPHPVLQEEAERVVKSIPQMIPGRHKGKDVKVNYSLPIIFQVNE